LPPGPQERAVAHVFERVAVIAIQQQLVFVDVEDLGLCELRARPRNLPQQVDRRELERLDTNLLLNTFKA